MMSYSVFCCLTCGTTIITTIEISLCCFALIAAAGVCASCRRPCRYNVRSPADNVVRPTDHLYATRVLSLSTMADSIVTCVLAVVTGLLAGVAACAAREASEWSFSSLLRVVFDGWTADRPGDSSSPGRVVVPSKKSVRDHVVVSPSVIFPCGHTPKIILSMFIRSVGCPCSIHAVLSWFLRKIK